jgi:hypothetical protein
MADVGNLHRQLERLEVLLPNVDLRALVMKDACVLRIDVPAAAQRLIFLDVELGHPDLGQLIQTAPQLLYCEVCASLSALVIAVCRRHM